MNPIDKIKRAWRRFAIPNIMTYVCITMVIILLGDYVSRFAISGMLSFIRPAVTELGQFWRVISFMFLPTNYSMLFAAVSIIFYYSIGRDLEAAWSSHKVTAYILTGWLLTLAAGFIGGYADNTYLYLSLFLAYAVIMPDVQFLMFFVIPMKAKWLAALDGVFMIYLLIFGGFSTRLCIAAALLTFVIFFGGDFIRPLKNKWKHREFISEMRRKNIKVTKNNNDE